jgi:hypothetical protein
VPAVIIHALLPVSNQFGTEQLEDVTPPAHGKLLRFDGGDTTGVCANAECALSTSSRTMSTIRGRVYLTVRSFVNLMGRLSESESDSFTSPRLGLHVI